VLITSFTHGATPVLELRHLKTLHALREADSLVEAAERLHLTQSALSHQFKELEERLGMQLFVRKTKPVRFTSAGLRLLQLADAALPLLRSAARQSGDVPFGTAGRLHMAIECHSCFQWLMPTIDQFRDAWPEVELDLASGFAFAPLPALARGDLDLVVTSDPLELAGITRRLDQRNPHHLPSGTRSTGHLHPFPGTGRHRTGPGPHIRADGDDDATGGQRSRRLRHAALGAA
jgi:DNA-binding transcriptional LysR family regulator